MNKSTVFDERQKNWSDDTSVYDSRDVNWSKSIKKLNMTNIGTDIFSAGDEWIFDWKNTISNHA